MNKKFLIVGILALAVFSSIAVAVWVVQPFASEGGGEVKSVKPITYTSTLSTQDLDVSESSAFVSEYIDVTGETGKNIDFTTTTNIVKTRNTSFVGYEECDYQESDYDVLVSPMSFTLNGKETKRVWINTTILEWSCPATIEINVNLTGVKA